ncbi:WapI family immunity protein [Sulfidibacter corallicola]|uniref:Uncharacterized protein n=1 Tax=Sulfidibacter corallicola TaxID=2818388 RepID=A0A8A4TKR3_SULCO|nr:hypothetical protein [Sulfidibacter corallicola]QTD50067.1 hypothetical protein J3U87_31165 [Sulfidibacter corallicola]
MRSQITISCEFDGYQFPFSADNDWQTNNWVYLKLIVMKGNERFSNTFAAMDTHEIIRMYQWFRCISEGRIPKWTKLGFIEPNISLHLQGCQDNVLWTKLHLSHEFTPDFPSGNPDPDDWFVHITLDLRDISEILSYLSSTMKRYPLRGKKPPQLLGQRRAPIR